DILFFSDSLGTTQLASEIESYDNVNGVLNAWVKVPTVSHSTDTSIYVFYGYLSPPSRTTNPWDSSFKSVWHLSETSGTTIHDFTTNGIGGTANANTSGTNTTGEIAGGQSFNGSSDYIASASYGTGPSSFTLE